MEPATIAMMVVGAIIAVLAMQNYRLRQEVHMLRNQVAALILIMQNKGVTNEYDRQALGRLGRARVVDPSTGHFSD